MADELTRNYGILVPKASDTMNQQVNPAVPGLVQNLRDGFERIEVAANPTVVSAPPLPQTGNYNIGDRVFLSDVNYRSSFILLSKSPWGWVWRPVQAAMAPWITVPSSAYSGIDGGYIAHPTKPLQFSLDNKGNCYWRGAIRKALLGLPNDDSKTIFASLPNGLRHHTSGMYTLAIDPATPQTDTGNIGFKGGRWYIDKTGGNSLRFHNAGSAQDIYFDGVEYVCSNLYYYSP